MMTHPSVRCFARHNHVSLSLGLSVSISRHVEYLFLYLSISLYLHSFNRPNQSPSPLLFFLSHHLPLCIILISRIITKNHLKTQFYFSDKNRWVCWFIDRYCLYSLYFLPHKKIFQQIILEFLRLLFIGFRYFFVIFPRQFIFQIDKSQKMLSYSIIAIFLLQLCVDVRSGKQSCYWFLK